MKFATKQKKTVEERRLEATRIKKKYTNRCPIICEYFKYKDTDHGQLDKNKFLVPKDMTIASFMQIIRRRMKIGAHDALYIFTAIGLPRSSMTIAELYEQAVDEDEFLYMAVRPEKTFGAH
jgi:GABA(A) receptor-associated protein